MNEADPRLSAVAGLDAARGLRHLRGRWDSYARLLRKFAETCAADAEAMRGHLAGRDYAGLSELMHNLKGAAGFLGAVELHELAAEICAAVRAGRDAADIERLAKAMMAAQSELSARILALIGPPSPAAGG